MAQGAFDDIPETGFGVLGNSAVEELDQVKLKIQSDGIHARCLCGRCNAKNDITVSWDEAIMGSLGFVPPNWQVDQATGTLFPIVGCANKCNYFLKIGFAPQELKRMVQTGIEQSFITKQYAEATAAQILAAAQRR